MSVRGPIHDELAIPWPIEWLKSPYVVGQSSGNAIMQAAITSGLYLAAVLCDDLAWGLHISGRWGGPQVGLDPQSCRVWGLSCISETRIGN